MLQISILGKLHRASIASCGVISIAIIYCWFKKAKIINLEYSCLLHACHGYGKKYAKHENPGLIILGRIRIFLNCIVISS